MPYIVIEGNIGAGKTSLAKLLGKHLEGSLLLEEFDDNPFLPLFYKEPARYALPLELSFLTDRFTQLTQFFEGTETKTVVGDYLFAKCDLFASANLNSVEYGLFRRLYKIIQQQVRVPDLIVYLECPISLLMQHIKKRGRSYEQEIGESYLGKIEETYKAFLEDVGIPIIRVDMSEMNFVENKDDGIRVLEMVRLKLK